MNVSLKPELAKFIEEQVKSGKYASLDDAMNAAVDRLRDDEQFEPDERDWAAIEESERQIERGEVHDWEDVRAGVHKKHCSGH